MSKTTRAVTQSLRNCSWNQNSCYVCLAALQCVQTGLLNHPLTKSNFQLLVRNINFHHVSNSWISLDCGIQTSFAEQQNYEYRPSQTVAHSKLYSYCWNTTVMILQHVILSRYIVCFSEHTKAAQTNAHSPRTWWWSTVYDKLFITIFTYGHQRCHDLHIMVHNYKGACSFVSTPQSVTLREQPLSTYFCHF